MSLMINYGIGSKLFSVHSVVFIICLSMLSCANRESVKQPITLEATSEVSADGSLSENQTFPAETAADGVTEDLAGSEQNNAVVPASGSDSSFKGDYIIGPEDLIEINVYQVDELSKIVRVSSSGFIKLPLAEKIKASGLTASELEAEISRHYDRYLQEPLVSVFIKEYRSQSITILGAVKAPQVYIVTRQKHLIDMISISGGLMSNAGDICFVRRGSETIIINLNDLLIGGDIRLNIPVFSGDIINVPIGGILFVDGSVNAPGSFGIKGAVTVTQAIAMAHGFKYEAVRDEVRIYRDSGRATKEIIDVDYDAILADKAPDIILQDKDILIVPESGVKKFWSNFVKSVSGATRIGTVSVGAGL